MTNERDVERLAKVLLQEFGHTEYCRLVWDEWCATAADISWEDRCSPDFKEPEPCRGACREQNARRLLETGEVHVGDAIFGARRALIDKAVQAERDRLRGIVDQEQGKHFDSRGRVLAAAWDLGAVDITDRILAALDKAEEAGVVLGNVYRSKVPSQ